MEVSSPTVLPVAGVQAPLRRRPRIFHVRRAEGMIPAPGRRSAFETVPAPWRVHSPRSALPPDANGREMAEARELESQRLRAHALSRR